MNKRNKIILFLIFLTAFVLRVFFLESLPPGISDDEAAIGYNAYLIAQTGRDEWNHLLPIQFRSFGEWKLPVYIYLDSLVLKFFPLSIFSVRIVSSCLGSLTPLLLYFFILHFLKKEKYRHRIAFLAALILTFNPWHIGLSRTASEANVGLFFFIGALYSFSLFMANKAKRVNFFLFLFCGILCVYSYNSYRLILPLFLIFSYFFHKRKIKIEFFAKNTFLIVFVMTLFFLLTKESFLTRFYQVNFFSDQGIVNKINEFRGDCLMKFPSLICRLFFNRPFFLLKSFWLNYFNHLSPQFLFFPEFEKAYSILPRHALFYSFDIFFFLWGLFILVPSKTRRKILLLLLIAPLPDSLTGTGNCIRSSPLILPVILISALGMADLIEFLKEKKLFFPILSASLLFYILLIMELIISYLNSFSLRQAKYSHYEYKPLFQYLSSIEDSYDHIYISKVNHDARQYIFYLFYFKINPSEYFNLGKKTIVDDHNWVWVKKLGKFEFIGQLGNLEQYPERSLLAIDPKGFEFSLEPKELITYPDGKRAFNIYDLDEVKYFNNNNDKKN